MKIVKRQMRVKKKEQRKKMIVKCEAAPNGNGLECRKCDHVHQKKGNAQSTRNLIKATNIAQTLLSLSHPNDR